jgi:hypothetical protein
MRSRNIKPGFFKNEILAECSPLARLLFAGLWCIADREGRLKDRPKRLKAELLPYDNCDVEKLLADLASKQDRNHEPAFIIRYGNGERYIQILHFLSHQNPHCAEQDSKLPAIVDCTPCTVQEPDKNSATTEVAGLIPDSLTLIPDIPLYVFAQFWSAYPKKKAKPDAERAWAKIKSGEMASVMNGLNRAKNTDDWKRQGGQFIPYPATWLNGRRWEDSLVIEIEDNTDYNSQYQKDLRSRMRCNTQNTDM